MSAKQTSLSLSSTGKGNPSSKPNHFDSTVPTRENWTKRCTAGRVEGLLSTRVDKNFRQKTAQR
jgi:hypothetical protein